MKTGCHLDGSDSFLNCTRLSTATLPLEMAHPSRFCAFMSTMGHVGRARVPWIVTLPDYQGVGIGTRVMEECCQLYKSEDRIHVNLQPLRVSLVSATEG